MSTAMLPDDLAKAMRSAAAARHGRDEPEPKPGDRPQEPGPVRQLRIHGQVVPFAVVGLLWAGGAAAASLDPGTGTLVGFACLTIAIAYWVVNAWKNPPRARRRRYATVVTICGSSWLMWAAHAGAGGWAARTLWAGGYILAAPFLRTRRIPTVAEDPVEEADWIPELPTEEADEDPVAARWANSMGKGKLIGSYLVDHQEVPNGDQWTIQLSDTGDHTTSTAVQFGPNIAAALKRSVDEVSVFSVDEPRADQARLMVVRRGANPLRRIHHYPGAAAAFDRKAGTAKIGVYADELATLWRLYEEGWGAKGGVVIGSTGSGKSLLLELLTVTAVDSEFIIPWVIDPKGGASLPAWVDDADWYATEPDEFTRVLRCFEKFVNIRMKLNALYRRPVHPITPAAPMLMLIVDECHEVFLPGSENGAIAERVARKKRAAGAAILAATQDAHLKGFADSAVLRGSLAAMNAVVMRSGSRQTASMLPGLELNPADLPEVKGIGYTIGARTAPFRGLYETPENTRALAALSPKNRFEPVVEGFLGSDYAERRERVAADRGAILEEFGDLDPEMVASMLEADPSLAEALEAHRRRPKIVVPASSPSTRRAVAPAWATLPEPPIFQAPKPLHPALKSPSARRIYTLVCSGVSKPAEMREKSGYSESQVAQVLRDLEKAGLLSNPRHGQWEKAA